jgi:hypothetical protein
VHAPHRSSPALRQSPSAPAPRSTPTVPSHHRPSPSRHLSPHTARYTTLVTVRSSRTHTHHHRTRHLAPRHDTVCPHRPPPHTTRSSRAHSLHKQLAPHKPLSTRSAPHRSPTTACSSQASPFYCLLLTDRPCYTACSSQAHVHTHTYNFTHGTTPNTTSPPTLSFRPPLLSLTQLPDSANRS